MSTSISMLDRILAIIEFVVDAEEKKQYLFTTSLIGTIIQDKGKREGSNYITLTSNPKSKIRKNKYKTEK